MRISDLPNLTLKSYLQRYWTLVSLGGLSILAIVIAILAAGHTLHPLIQAQDFSDFQLHLRQLCGWIALLAFASFGRSYCLARLSVTIIRCIKEEVLSSLLQQTLSFYDHQSATSIIQRFQEQIHHLQHFLGVTLGVMLRNSLMLMGGLILLFITSAFLTLIALATIPLILLPISLLLRTHRKRMKKAQTLGAQEATFTAELLQNISIIQAFTAEESIFERFLHLLRQTHHAVHHHIQIRSILSALVIFLTTLSICGIISIGVYGVNTGRLSPGALASFLFYAIVVATAFSSFTDLLADRHRAVEALRQLQDLYLPSTLSAPLYHLLPSVIQGILAIQQVSFGYPHHPEPCVLNNLTFSAAPGEVTAIVGPSGAGKSTLFSLLLGFYKPQAGQIFLDGTDQAKVNLREWRQHFGWVPQEPFIFADTLLNNLTMRQPTICEEEIWQILEEVALTNFVKSTAEGLQTLLGQGGIQLSVGQKQRLAVARVRIRNPRILLLDEATTGLDAASEHHVNESLKHLMRTRTTLIITHRLKTVLQANRIVVLNQGQIEAMGTHAELISQPGLYQRLARLEFAEKARA